MKTKTAAEDVFRSPLAEPKFLGNADSATGRIGQVVRSTGLAIVTFAAVTAGSAAFVSPACGSESYSFRVEIDSDYHLTAELTEWQRWLDQLSEDLVGTDVLQAIRLATDEVIKPLGLVPDGALTPEGAYLMVWDFDQHHIELELYSGQMYDWFYRNRKTGRLDGEEDLELTCGFQRFKQQLTKYQYRR